MTYLLQVSTCWIFFFGIYLLFLRKETFFSINRYYLLGALLTGLVVPYLGALIPANEASLEVYQVMTQFSTIEVTQVDIVQEAAPIFTWTNLLWSIYILGGLVVFSRFIYGLNRIYQIYKSAEKTEKANYTLVESEIYHLPFSFFHFIFISKQLPLNSEVEKVLKHEELHANQWHSLDIVFTELLQVFFWFNPILIMYKGALRQSHEYLADAYVTKDHNKNSYGRLLLQQSTSGMEVALANQFFHSQIKKRITMMYKEKSKRSAMVKYLAAVPVLVAMLLIFSSNQMENSEPETTPTIELSHVFDFDIRVEKDGVYTFPPTDKETQDITNYFQGIREEGRSVKLSIDLDAPSDKVAALLDCASKNDVGVILNENDHMNHKTNFGGRAITVRNWHEFWYKYKSHEGIISIIAEANADGDIVYIEIDQNKTTIQNKIILKDALRAAKGFKVEKGTSSDKGTITFQLGGTSHHQGHIYDANSEGFKYDKDIYLGEQIPEGSVQVSIKDELLSEGQDYTINYRTGKLKLNELYSGQDPVNVSFNKEMQPSQTDPIFKVVEEMPRFPGCEDMKASSKEIENCSKQKMLEHIYSNLKYPASARDQNVEGMVVVQFVVEKDGSITGSKILRDIGAGCGTESQRVVDAMPTWRPGLQGGKAVRVQYILPVKFKLEGPAPEEKVVESKMVTVVGFGSNNKEMIKEKLVKRSEIPASDDLYKVAQEMPRLIGCEDQATSTARAECAEAKMLEFIYTNIKYPKEARAKGIDGVTIVQFVVNTDGTMSNLTVVRDPGAGLGAEAKRVIGNLPKWIPGKQDGKTVKVIYTLPVRFKLEGGQKEEAAVGVSNKGEITLDELRIMKGINQFTSKMIGKDCELLGYRVVLINANENPLVNANRSVDFDSKSKELFEKARVGSRIFIENIKAKCKGDLSPTDHGAISLVIVEDKIGSILEGKKSGIDLRNGESENGTKIRLRSPNSKGNEPLYVIDGKVKPEVQLEKIAPDDIKAINVLKGEKALEKYGNKGQNGVIEITMKPYKERTKYLIDGQLFGADFYNTIDKSHINKEGPASQEDKFMRGIEGELIIVNMLAGYGFNSAYFPGTNTEDGSNQALMNFVGNNITYPKAAIDNDIEGMVTVRYTVEADGQLTNFKIGRSLGWGLDQAVLDMMKKLADEKGSWTAAYLDRRSVSSSMTLPVKFKLQSHQKDEAKSRRLSVSKFDVSPNPSDGRFNIKYELDGDTAASLTFYTSNGAVIKTMNNLPAKNTLQVDLSNQSSSIIYVALEQGGKVKTIKASIQN